MTLPRSVGIIRLVGGISLVPGHQNVSDAIGHAALHALLTLVIYWALRPRVGFGRAFWAAILIVLALGAITEISQHYTPGRAMVLSDLLGNWLGVMSMATLIGFHQSLMNQ
jgi:VanZ family protein